VQCAVHPGASAVGLCVACRTGLCSSCSTRLQGRNFCASCLEKVSLVESDEDVVSAGVVLRGLLAASVLVSGLLTLACVSGLGFLIYMAG